MPRYTRPGHSETVEAAIDAFGNRVRVAILGYLFKHGPAGRAEIARELKLGSPSTLKHLQGLEAVGVIIADPPLEEHRRGQRVKYRVNGARIRVLYDALGRELGQKD